jgi:DNA-binding CsgD family transcriptional regulator
MPATRNHSRPSLPRTLMRQKLAAACQSMLAQVAPLKLSAPLTAGLSPRMRDTLQHLLAGDSEKEVALKLKLSPHTVHIHVKSIYKRFKVSSRGELMAKCLGRNGRSR